VPEPHRCKCDETQEHSNADRSSRLSLICNAARKRRHKSTGGADQSEEAGFFGSVMKRWLQQKEI
jgi:hypothetical protein